MFVTTTPNSSRGPTMKCSYFNMLVIASRMNYVSGARRHGSPDRSFLAMTVAFFGMGQLCPSAVGVCPSRWHGGQLLGPGPAGWPWVTGITVTGWEKRGETR